MPKPRLPPVATEAKDAAAPQGLHRALGLPELVLYGVGLILGAGIYSVIGPAARIAGESIWLSFLLAALVAALTGLSYAELSSMFPKAGGTFVFIRRAAPNTPLLAFLAGSLLVFASVAGAVAVALAFGGYASHFVAVPVGIVALVLLFVLTGVALLGIQESAWLNAIFTLVEVGGLVAFVLVGSATPGFGAAVLTEVSPGVFAATALVFFAYLGFENIVNLAEEVRDPGRNMPAAIVVSVLLSGVLYVLVAVAAVALLPPDQLGASSSPLNAALEGSAPWLADAVGGIALFATANTVLIMLIVGGRLIYGMAWEGDLPALFRLILPRRRTPWIAGLAVLVMCLPLLPFGRVEVVAGMTNFASLLAFVGVNLSLIVIRIRNPGLPRPFRVPGSFRGVPVPSILGVVGAALILTQLDPVAILSGGVAILAATVVYLILRRARALRRTGQGRVPRRSG